MKSMTTCLLALTLLAACGGDDTGDGGDGGDGDGGPVYAMMTQVYTVDDRIVYLSLTDTLDIATLELPLAEAREFASVANFAAIDGQLYVSSGEQPIITRFDISPSLEWREGPSVSFAAFPFSDNANFYYHYIVDADTAILPYDVNKRIVWSPREMAIVTDLDDSALALDDGGMLLEGGGNRSAVRFPDGRLLQPFFRHDADWLAYGADSYIAAYDAGFAETATFTVPCPGLEISTRDEAGVTYFSTNWYSPVRALYGDAPGPCVARVDAAGDLDEAWTTDLRDLTGGRHVVNFRYLRGGKAVGNVVYDEELEADFTGPYDATVEDQLWAGNHVRPWLFDLDAGTAVPITGLDVPGTPALQNAVIDGRMFLFAVFPDYDRTRIFEVTDDAVAHPMFDVAGDVFKWERLR
jgi:hypothetical protein